MAGRGIYRGNGVLGFSVLRYRDLPAGVTAADCDGRDDPLCDADGEGLWRMCGGDLREAMAGDFANFKADDIRDALLDAMEIIDAGTRRLREGDEGLGRRLRRMWIGYRDRELGELHRKGRLREGPPGG